MAALNKKSLLKRKLKFNAQISDYSELIERKRLDFLAELNPSEEELRTHQELFAIQQEEQKVTDRDRGEQHRFAIWMEDYFTKNNINLRFFKHRYFHKFFEEEGIERPDVFIVSAQKTSGKTYSMCEIATEILKDPFSQIVWLRNTRVEIESGFYAQLEGEEYPFRLVKQSWKLQRKHGYLPERERFGDVIIPGIDGTVTSTHRTQKRKRNEALKKAEEENPDLDFRSYDPDHCGYALWVSGEGLRQFQGGSHRKVKALFWDECNDLGGITQGDIQNVHTNILSWTRDKKKMDIYIALNNLRHKDGTLGNLVLENFGIPYGAGWKRFKTDRGLNVFFVDLGKFGDLFRGPDNQAHFGLLGGIRGASDLINNDPVTVSNKTLTMGAFLHCHPVWAIVTRILDKFYVVYLAFHINEQMGIINYVCNVDQYSSEYRNPEFQLFTDDEVIANQFGSVILKKPKWIGRKVKQLCQIQKKRNLFFANDGVRILFTTDIMRHFKTQYSQDLEKFLKTRKK